MTSLNIRWLNKALINLDDEAQHIATDSLPAAKKMVQKIRITVELLGNNPSLGRPGRITGTRELIIDNLPYIIPYRVHNRNIEILRVFHTSRKLPSRW
ncbi:MAG: type II toxin-antitoxin system RelE/ParE family toxin [Methylococcales symbiont of Hymedesmia sp. n. MRB-2018]|nr:MAG: type II toxin-antitoxin system RelE/ParE family toxin [Methylococcales symbiont of Iophon sp. n. MRB-2018]KAF3979594.1 MAG: type II toxin-antitoxin system RelE/ParE family toxin [Methylococcales symbiont of Iophon sp. n. MRB-2018]KAF3982651.1 MAG: type II toxin-antitoxin system RelE/ParE family toxin [Methylococcales symbiont of Hymedesmia sp. n. MRB-2018]KAF3983778.1 MAG: type II toxin-antitoxin system RelE/ParE family toxin [Methylococcales symbiont of Hymedesmia sp. n. MRB-2018]